jgi:hypothetical protein
MKASYDRDSDAAFPNQDSTARSHIEHYVTEKPINQQMFNSYGSTTYMPWVLTLLLLLHRFPVQIGMDVGVEAGALR